MLIDSHCHLDYFDDTERPAVLARATAAGVREMVTIGTSLAQSRNAITIAEGSAQVWACIGVHPHNAGGEGGVPTAETIAAMTEHPKVIGIGETGLDYFYEKSPRTVQAASFAAHIQAAQRTQLPLAIHARDADDDIIAMLESAYATQKFNFLLHCFSSGRPLAERAVAIGGYISLSGILTFPKSDELRKIASAVPLDRLLVETDSPYLAPAPLRGKRNEPANTIHTARVLATLLGIDAASLAELTTNNFRRLFTKTA